jgi:dephospho-CoA kinase
MVRVGLSGTRYSGKNAISTLFRQIGIPIFDADVLIKFILRYNYTVLERIKSELGSKYFIMDDIINYKEIIKDGIFNKIIDIIRDDIINSYDNFIRKNSKSQYIIFHSSILFDRSDIYNQMDYTICVYAPISKRLERACHVNNNNSFDYQIQTNHKLSKEKDELEKNKMADFTIHNYGDIDVLNQINEIDKKIVDSIFKSRLDSIKK